MYRVVSDRIMRCHVTYVHHHAALQFALLSQSPTQYHAGVEADTGQQAPEHAVLAEVLSNATNSIARHYEGDHTQSYVLEAAKQPDFPLS